MGFFKNNYNKPGPGVPKNAPKKKGISRFIEIIARDFGNLVKLNVLFTLCILPAQVCFFLMLRYAVGGNTLFFYLFAMLALVASLLVGPALTSLFYLVTKMLRDEPGFLWHDFKKAFKENAKQTALPGLVYSLVVGSQVFSFLYYTSVPHELNVGVMVLFLMSVLLFIMITPYFFAQPPYLHLNVGAMLKNSFLLAVGYAPYSFIGALMGGGLVIVQFLLLPLSPVVTLFIGYSIPCLLNLMWIWPRVDEVFKISETLQKRNAENKETEI